MFKRFGFKSSRSQKIEKKSIIWYLKIMVNLSLQSDLKILSESNSTEWYIKDNKNTHRVIEIPIHYDDTNHDHMLIEKWIYKIDIENLLADQVENE